MIYLNVKRYKPCRVEHVHVHHFFFPRSLFFALCPTIFPNLFSDAILSGWLMAHHLTLCALIASLSPCLETFCRFFSCILEMFDKIPCLTCQIQWRSSSWCPLHSNLSWKSSMLKRILQHGLRIPKVIQHVFDIRDIWTFLQYLVQCMVTIFFTIKLSLKGNKII